MNSTFLIATFGGLVAAFSKFIFDFFLARLSIGNSLKKRKGEILLENRMAILDKIFIVLEKSFSNAIINKDINSVEKLLLEISKNSIPLGLYFSEEENMKLNRVIDEIKLSSQKGYKNWGQFRVVMEEYKKCLGVN
ncbi:MAG: hypothetical protein E7022_04055 [Desulfovibrio desulfuricans]|nr:hypothetical protein [Desulfovibrio desulfuricans]